MTEAGVDEAPVLSGYFEFADLRLLVLSLAAARGDFVDAVSRYVAKRPMHALSSTRWLDFGHLHTYYQSRGKITTERAFNSLAVGKRVVAKRSMRPDRIRAEAGWYEQVPPDLRIYLPNYIGREEDEGGHGYMLEFLFLPSLADLFVFGRLPEMVWLRILQSCSDFFAAAARHRAPRDSCADVMDLYLRKTVERLTEFASRSGIDLDRGWRVNGIETPGLREIAQRSSVWISPPEPRHLSIVHGDPCFSTILYDFRSYSVRVIDPRGQDAAGRPTIWGDNRYDLAKLHHSIIGNYDLIIAGFHQLTSPEPYSVTIDFPASATFDATRSAFARVFGQAHATDLRSVEAISLHLFLSMLPLHADSEPRQQALLANALRLYADMAAREDAR